MLIGTIVGSLPTRSPRDVPRRDRRLELYCVHGSKYHLLAVVAREHLITDLYMTRYPDDGHVEEINCVKCRTRWQLSMTALRERVDRRRGLEKVPLSEIATTAGWNV